MGQKVRYDTALAVLSIGILELLVGLCILITCFVFQGKQDTPAIVPYWAAVPLLLCGILGVVGGATKNKCAVIGYLVVSIIMTIIMFMAGALVALASAIINLAIDYMTRYSCYTRGNECVCYTNSNKSSTKSYDGSCGRMKAIGGLLRIMAGLSIVGGLLCLAGCIAGCAALCCMPEEPTVIIAHQQPNTVVIHQQHPQEYPPEEKEKPAIEPVQPGY